MTMLLPNDGDTVTATFSGRYHKETNSVRLAPGVALGLPLFENHGHNCAVRDKNFVSDQEKALWRYLVGRLRKQGLRDWFEFAIDRVAGPLRVFRMTRTQRLALLDLIEAEVANAH